MILPIFLPLMFSFAMTLGYVLLFLGYMLVASAMGENDHPRWPEWHPAEISEGIARWIWALLLGVAGGWPVAAYWGYGREINWLHGVVIVNLVVVGTAFGQMALAAALLHETILAANPVTVLIAIVRHGMGLCHSLHGHHHCARARRTGRLRPAFPPAQDVDGSRGSLGILGVRAL